MNNGPNPLHPEVIDVHTSREVLGGGPAPQPMPRLRYSYNRQEDVLDVEGIRYAGEMFRMVGFGAPANTPLKILKRDDGVLTMVLMERGDPDWNTPKDEHGRINVGWFFPEEGRAVGIYLEPDAPPAVVAAGMRFLADLIEGKQGEAPANDEIQAKRRIIVPEGG